MKHSAGSQLTWSHFLCSTHQGISLDGVARDTHLSKRYLLALEDEAIHKLPHGRYNRAYVRTYAGYLGLDSDSLVRDYLLGEEEAQTQSGLALRPDVLATMRQAASARGHDQCRKEVVSRRSLASVGFVQALAPRDGGVVHATVSSTSAYAVARDAGYR